MNHTTIEWTDATWNPVRGCSRVSPGCKNCYAERVAARLSGTTTRNAKEPPKVRKDGNPFHGFAIMTNSGPRWTGKVALVESKLEEPLSWKEPQRIFVNSMSDLFHEDLPFEAIDQVFAVMAMARHHTFQVLTKRADRMFRYLQDKRGHFTCEYQAAPAKSVSRLLPLSNVWFGVSVEDGPNAAVRIDYLRRIQAAVRFISYEPALGPLDVVPYLDCLDWVIAGGESGPNARPPNPDWFRAVRNHCTFARIPFFFKQWGEWAPEENGFRHRARRWGICARDGRWYEHGWHGYHKDQLREGDAVMIHVGKKAAGDALDGSYWHQFPAPAWPLALADADAAAEQHMPQ